VEGNKGIDPFFTGRGAGSAKFALAEAKASFGLNSLAVDSLGYRQGSRNFFLSRLQWAGRTDLMSAFYQGDVEFFRGFEKSRRLVRFNPNAFVNDANFRTNKVAIIMLSDE
jgi:hypothetical protein